MCSAHMVGSASIHQNIKPHEYILFILQLKRVNHKQQEETGQRAPLG